MIKIFYNSSIFLLSLVLGVLSWVNPKIKKRRIGLRNQKISPKDESCILVHCASAGEFEQIIPVIRELKSKWKNERFVFSFFSSSGIEWINRVSPSLPHYYLPIDQKSSIEPFINSLKPKIVLISKNELWFNFINLLDKKNIPHYLISASFKKNHFAFKFNYFIQAISSFKRIFVISELDKKNVGNKLQNIVESGDTRIDQILKKSKSSSIPDKLKLDSEKPIVILASIHKEDIFLLEELKESEKYHFIVVPHEVDDKSINQFISHAPFKNLLRYSEIEKWNGNPLIIDTVGILASLYQISTLVYVGGGFGQGIHNVLEPAIYENIIFIGPNNNTFAEARDLIDKESIIEIRKKESILDIYETLGESQKKKMRHNLSNYFNNKKGASKKIANLIITDFENTET